MNFPEQEKSEVELSTCLINDENNNFQNSSCTNCEYLEDQKTERMIIIPDISSDEEYCCSSCSSINDSELISLDTRKLWHDIAHIIKCIYRETSREFSENHSTNDICKAKGYIRILTQSNPESLFHKIESIVLEYVDEIRNQVLKRSQTYLKTSNDVQLFISYLLDEYNTFIQAAKNVSTIVSDLEEHYMKSFHLTWVLYNKYLYEKLVYMDKKIQQSMSMMIDLLQPSNEHPNDYSPAEYTQLLNRFLAFDEEMSEIACLYKDCQMKMISMTRNSLVKNRNPLGIIVKSTKKKICKKTKRIKNIQGLTKENFNSSTSNAMNIPLSTNSSTVPMTSQQDSNGSSIGSDLGGKESSSISSFDEYLLDNNTSSSSYTKEESDHLIPTTEELDHGIVNNVEEKPNKEIPITDKEQTSTVPLPKKSKSTRRKENPNPLKSSFPSDLFLPPKPPSKFQADFRPLTIPLLTKTEIPACPSLLSAKIQSVSFTAGTFGSITSHESSLNPARLSLNLRKSGSTMKTDSTIAYNNLDELLRQAASPNEISALLSSLESSKPTDELPKDKNCDFCCCDLFSESNSSTPNGCVTCMSLPNPTTITCSFNQRDVEMKERLKLKLTKRTVQNTFDQPKSSPGNKSKSKPCDNNIDDLVRYIDGNEGNSTEIIAKKTKKKKEKQNKITPKIPIVETPQPISKRKQKSKFKSEQEEQPIDQSSITHPPIPPTTTSLLPKKPDSKEINTDLSTENLLSPEEEVNWITISRKQSKHKPASVPSLLAVPIAPPNNSKQKRQQTINKTKISNPQALAQQKVIPETVINSNKQQTATALPTRVQNTVKPPIPQQQQQKTETPSAWTTPHEQIQVPPSSTLLATAPAFVPSSSLLIPTKTNDILPLEQPTSSPYWDPTGYLLPPGPVQRPTSSFSPAPGPRCIRRPSPEPSSTASFPVYSPMNYTIGNSTSTWNDNTSGDNTNESQWKYPYEEQLPTSTIPNDFPLYDPFNSGASLRISPSTLLTNGFEEHLHIPQDNDIDEMNALEKEIEDFKKCLIDNIPIDPCGKSTKQY